MYVVLDGAKLLLPRSPGRRVPIWMGAARRLSGMGLLGSASIDWIFFCESTRKEQSTRPQKCDAKSGSTFILSFACGGERGRGGGGGGVSGSEQRG